MNSFIKILKIIFTINLFAKATICTIIYAFKKLQIHLSQSIQIAKQNYVKKLLKDWVVQLLSVSATGHF